MNPYLSVFLESLWVASLFPFSQQPTFFAMQGFGGFNMQLAAVLAFAGSLTGLCMNYAVGALLLSQYRKGRFNMPEGLHEKASRIFNRYLVFLLLLGWFTIFNYIPVIAGFLAVPLRIALPLMVVGQAGYYAFYLFGA